MIESELTRDVTGDAPAEGARRRPSRGYWRESLHRLLGNRVAVTAAAFIAVVALIALAAPLLSAVVTHHRYFEQDLGQNFAPPLSAGHLLGTDELGRDTLTRLIWGAQVSLGVGVLTVAISITLGSLAGLAAGFYRGIVDDLLMRLVDIVLATPRLYLFILVGIIFYKQSGLVTLSLVIASVGWGGTARLVRGEVLGIAESEFMIATRSVGASDVRLIVRHLLPNVLPVMIVAASLGVGGIILVEAALDYLGFGIHPPTPSWGNMLSSSQQYFVHSAWLVVLPGACIFLTVLATTLLGNALRDAFDPRLR
jgi:peptide/nickel transport system permease protein